MTERRPSFSKPRAAVAYDSPEELFSKLPNRNKSHGYLRGPQVDALREYAKHLDAGNIALELPTGTGKTTVGLLIAEWCRRRSSKRAAFLALTNQLAGQVLLEAERLGLECADLRGDRTTRDAGEVGRYQTAQCVAVTTYSNLFNINPVVQVSDLIVLDDAHGGEQYVSGMWTVRVGSELQLYLEMLAILRPALSDAQYRVLKDELSTAPVELVDIHQFPEILSELTETLDRAEDPRIRFPWGLVRNHIDACLVFASRLSITIRPVVPPTHTHEQFSQTRQRIYTSATLGGEGDLRRSYGISDITTIRAQHPQWGKRYIFTPGLFMDEEETAQVIGQVWRDLESRRALFLTPSFAAGDRVFEGLRGYLNPAPIRLGASEIEESLEPFTGRTDTILCLAGRYDGLDLPGDDCRLLLMAESPAAVGALERNQREYWKLGPILRRRERTRLIQGMGRCTRDATDFAVILLLGQSLVNSITNPDLSQGFPAEIQREIQWGVAQAVVFKEDPDALGEMIVGLLNDESYRKQANENQEEIALKAVVGDSERYDEGSKSEVKFARSMWERNFTRAFEVARTAADEAVDEELAGYRAWWLYLGSVAARAKGDIQQEADCLRRARAIGINAGYLDGVLRRRSVAPEPQAGSDPSSDTQAEGIWGRLEQWGWHGPKFGRRLEEMKAGLSSLDSATQFHVGIEYLGQCLGAEVLRPTGQGAPDAAWIFFDRSFTFEAKSLKGHTGALAKKEVLQAKGHPDWLRAQRPDLELQRIDAVVVSHTTALDAAARPHAKALYHITPQEMQVLGGAVAKALNELRAEFAGKEYASVRGLFKGRLASHNLSIDKIYRLLSGPLASG